MRYVVFQTPDQLPPGATTLQFAEGRLAEVVARLLEEMTLPELHALELHGIRKAKRVVAQKTVERCSAKVQSELNTGIAVADFVPTDASGNRSLGPSEPEDDTYSLDDRFDLIEPVLRPDEAAVSAADDTARDLDEDGDEVMCPTPLEVVDPNAGVNEADGQ